MRIIVTAFSSLTTDQRIRKTCDTLLQDGHSVLFIGCDWNDSIPLELPYPYHRIAIKTKTLKLAYAEFNFKLYCALFQNLVPKDLVYVNDLDAIPASFTAAKKLGCSIIADHHEIFSEMPAIQGKLSQKIWRVLENYYVPKIPVCITESQSYAEWYEKKYGVQPRIVRNVPKYQNFIPENKNKDEDFILYQGVLNPSRGLFPLLEAIQLDSSFYLKIAGDGPLRIYLENKVKELGISAQVEFLGKLLPHDLLKVTREAAVGVSLEENAGVSYLYSLPNKICDYIQARVPVLGIHFPEIERIFSTYHIGEILTDHKPENIAAGLNKIVKNGRAHYLPDLDSAARELCWENEEKNIIEAVWEASQM